MLFVFNISTFLNILSVRASYDYLYFRCTQWPKSRAAKGFMWTIPAGFWIITELKLLKQECY
jgi:hypothetical protein